MLFDFFNHQNFNFMKIFKIQIRLKLDSLHFSNIEGQRSVKSSLKSQYRLLKIKLRIERREVINANIASLRQNILIKHYRSLKKSLGMAKV